jgi:hypothetical protein
MPGGSREAGLAAQERWLTMFGRNLAMDFELDPLTILVRTSCFH